MKIAVLQMQAPEGAVESNCSRIGAALRAAAAGGARLLVAPELAIPGYGAGSAFAERAEAVDGPSLTALGAIVEDTGTALVVGFAEAGADGAVYNAAAALLPGAATRVYRKAQLYGDYERAHFTAGPVAGLHFDLDGVGIGLLICYDVEFPEHVRRLARAGCDLVLVPTALPDLPAARMVAERVVPVRAFENQIFVAYADLAGHDGRFAYAGLSCIVGPDGADLARAAADGDALLTALIDPPAYAASRADNPYLTDLRLPA